MDEEFIKQFIGKQVAVVGFGVDLGAGVKGKIVSVNDGILRMEGGDSLAFFDIDGIYAILPDEAI